MAERGLSGIINADSMDITEAFVLRKIQYGEADYIISLFTENLGKIRALAKNARRSRKRFGGRLEPFLQISAKINARHGGMKFIEDAEIVRSFPRLTESVSLFFWGSFILETVEILLPDQEPNGEAFALVSDTFAALNRSGGGVLGEVLSFHLRMLSLCGYEPQISSCLRCGANVGGGGFDIRQGGVLCLGCAAGGAANPRWSGGDCAEDLIANIRILTKFTEYQTGREFKTSKFLEDFI
ncbi:MAG: DNA repair protein RecO [Deltaproteobacteria bacterium]